MKENLKKLNFDLIEYSISFYNDWNLSIRKNHQLQIKFEILSALGKEEQVIVLTWCD